MSAQFPTLIDKEVLLKIAFGRLRGEFTDSEKNILNILFLYSEGKDGYQIAKEMKISARTIYRYLRVYFNGGIEALFPEKRIKKVREYPGRRKRDLNDKSIFIPMSSPCIHGHTGMKYRSNGRCVQCSDSQSKSNGKKPRVNKVWNIGLFEKNG